MNSIPIAYFSRANNCGDLLGPRLVEYITGKPIRQVPVGEDLDFEHYFTVGSIIARSRKNTVVWGSGFLRPCPLIAKPKRICAVRGPLTQQLLTKYGIDCPKIYGDPALLFPRYFYPEVKIKYDIGIIPHYVDRRVPILNTWKEENALIIDIQRQPEEVVTDILSCKVIASSAMHGLILAHAYGKPAIQLKLSEKVIGADFKFNDYLQSLGDATSKPFVVNDNTTLKSISDQCHITKINLNLDVLLQVCPWEIRNG